jgi:hypothetical protein
MCNSHLDRLTVRLLPQVQHDSNGFVFQKDVAPCDFHIAIQNYLNTHHPWSWIVLAWAGDFMSCRWPSKSPAFNSGRHLVELLEYESQALGSASAAILAGAEVANCRFMASLCTEFGTSRITLSTAALWYAQRPSGFCEMCEKLLNVCWLMWMWYHSTFVSVPVWKSVVLFWSLCSWGLGMMLVPNLSTFSDWFNSWVWVHGKKW